jgi:hypothetical protein
LFERAGSARFEERVDFDAGLESQTTKGIYDVRYPLFLQRDDTIIVGGEESDTVTDR